METSIRLCGKVDAVAADNLGTEGPENHQPPIGIYYNMGLHIAYPALTSIFISQRSILILWSLSILYIQYTWGFDSNKSKRISSLKQLSKVFNHGRQNMYLMQPENKLRSQVKWSLGTNRSW